MVMFWYYLPICEEYAVNSLQHCDIFIIRCYGDHNAPIVIWLYKFGMAGIVAMTSFQVFPLLAISLAMLDIICCMLCIAVPFIYVRRATFVHILF